MADAWLLPAGQGPVIIYKFKKICQDITPESVHELLVCKTKAFRVCVQSTV